MTQSDLFEMPNVYIRRGDSIVPPTPDELARHKRDRGIKRAADHADAVDRGWQDRAVGYVPPDGRAWGGVMQRAAREGVIKRIGYAPARSSNLSPKVKWGRV